VALLTAQNKTDLLATANEAAFAVVANAIRAANGYVLPEDWWIEVSGPGGIQQQLRTTWADANAFKNALVWDPVP
jgi:hypothetical protein